MATVKNPRTKLVNFRVSEDEFQTLQALTENSGARSMSDLARSRALGSGNLQEPVNSVNNAALIVAKVGKLESQMTGLSAMMTELLGRLATPSPSINPEEQPVNGSLPH